AALGDGAVGDVLVRVVGLHAADPRPEDLGGAVIGLLVGGPAGRAGGDDVVPAAVGEDGRRLEAAALLHDLEVLAAHGRAGLAVGEDVRVPAVLGVLEEVAARAARGAGAAGIRRGGVLDVRVVVVQLRDVQ